jgi:hypothetical protein
MPLMVCFRAPLHRRVAAPRCCGAKQEAGDAAKAGGTPPYPSSTYELDK